MRFAPYQRMEEDVEQWWKGIVLIQKYTNVLYSSMAAAEETKTILNILKSVKKHVFRNKLYTCEHFEHPFFDNSLSYSYSSFNAVIWFLHTFSTKFVAFVSIDIRFIKIHSHVVIPIKTLHHSYLLNCMASTIPIQFMHWSQHKDSQVLEHLVSICHFT